MTEKIKDEEDIVSWVAQKVKEEKQNRAYYCALATAVLFYTIVVAAIIFLTWK